MISSEAIDVLHGSGATAIECGDALEVLDFFPSDCVQCVITSPPYWGLRDYGVVGQLGLEPTPDEYIEKLVAIFSQVKRVLRPDGTLWLNLGDSYAGGKTGRTDGERNGVNGFHGGQNKKDIPARQRVLPKGLKQKDLVGIPWRVALALQADGWYLRADIIWHKPNPMPSSVTDRPTTSHEYVFLLSKQSRYYYDADAIRVPYMSKPHAPGNKTRKGDVLRKDFGTDRMQAVWGHPAGANRRSVWTIATQAYKGAHFATFPEKLVTPCLLAGTPEHGCCAVCESPYKRLTKRIRRPTRVVDATTTYKTKDPGRHVTEVVTDGWAPGCECGAGVIPSLVLDPFAGSGTVGKVCKDHNRRFLGIELNPAYIALADKRINYAA